MMVMRMVALGFDMDPIIRNKEKKPPKIAKLPNLLEYMGYCLFPTTSIFGPFLVYKEHIKFLDSSPIVMKGRLYRLESFKPILKWFRILKCTLTKLVTS